MEFVIVGYGRVGARTATILSTEGHGVVIVDNDEDRIKRARDDGHEAIEGDAGDESVLERAGISDADALAALTTVDRAMLPSRRHPASELTMPGGRPPAVRGGQEGMVTPLLAVVSG
jgi:nucleoside-diphosphate-sugar epimerase